jgi:thiamine kinase-like enzyme
MEKLNTLPFTNMWDSMEKLLMKMPGNTYSTLEYVVKNIGNPIVKKTWDNLAKYIKQQDPSIASKVDEFYKMVDELYKITPKPDIRQFNFGYNKEGILKALDI